MNSVPAIFRRLYSNRTGLALVFLSIALPGALFALAAWQSYGEAERQQDARVERTTRILQEHAIKVFETHRLVIEQVEARVRGIDWNDAASTAALQVTLQRLQAALDQIAAITIVDAQGRPLASSRVFPADNAMSFADRDWFKTLQAEDAPAFYISRSYDGRQSKQQVFNMATRLPSPDGHFAGAIAVSVGRAYFEAFYRTIEPDFAYRVVLLRSDGAILARVPDSDVKRISPDGVLLRRVKSGDTDVFISRSGLDGRVRITALRPISTYPVFVIFGLDRDSAFGPWRRTILFYGIAASLAATALLLVSALAIRQTQRWKTTTTALRREAASRQVAEEKLRQAQKMEAVGQLTGGIAHDFNNLLTGILGSLDLLQARIAQGRIAETGRYIAAAQGAGTRAAALTHRLLAFSRRQTLEPRATNVNRLVADIEDLIQRTMGPPIEVENVGLAGLWTVYVDPNQLENALLNLCINARDAMPGGGKLTIETNNRRLDQRAAAERDLAPGDYVSLCVSDTGTGMPPDVIAKAFDPFFTTKPIGAGTGLGLSMTYGFARQSGGQVRIYSEVGRGTLVCIYLPRHLGEETADVPAAAPEALQAGRGDVVLVVDDEETVRLLVADVLRELGYAVLLAADGTSGIALLESDRRIDLLITDIGLPGTIDGRQVAAAARRCRPALKTLFITGYAENALIGHGILDADMPVLTKPFPVDVLARRVKALLAA